MNVSEFAYPDPRSKNVITLFSAKIVLFLQQLHLPRNAAAHGEWLHLSEPQAESALSVIFVT